MRTWDADSYVVTLTATSTPQSPGILAAPCGPVEVTGEIIVPKGFKPSKLVGDSVRIGCGAGPTKDFKIQRAYTLRKRLGGKSVKFHAEPYRS